VTVVLCKSHNKTFTIYPPGHVPYGRCPIAPVAPDGSLLRMPLPAPANSTQVDAGKGCFASLLLRAQAFSGTIFDAALDAAQGKTWRRADSLTSSEHCGDGCWTTQCRRIESTARLLGIHPLLSIEEQLKAAEALSVPALLLTESARNLALSGGCFACGKAVVQVLAEMPQRTSIADRLMQSGYIVSLWQEPLRWDPRRGLLLLRKPFHPPGTRAPPSIH